MDLVTRKKLLMRKYNNDMFNNQELQFFNKINASQIIVLFKQNAHLRTCQTFFQHIAIKQVEKIIATIFEPEDNFYRTQTFNMLVNILKLNTTLLEICFNQDQFNYMCIFGFLEEEHIDYTTLILLEDILLPYIRKIPYKVPLFINIKIQIMQIFSMDSYVQSIIMNRIYQKPLFKIIYTVVFCLSKKHSQIYEDEIKLIVNQIVNTPFTYLNHRQKIISQKSKLNLQVPTSPTKKSKSKDSTQDNGIQISPVRKKVIRKNHKNLQENGSDESLEQIKSPMIKLSQTNNKYTPFSSKIQKSVSLTLQRKLSKEREQSSNKKNSRKQYESVSLSQNYPVKHYSPKKLKNQQFLHELQRQQSIPLNQDLDYADLAYNMRDLFIDLANNIKSVYLKNVMILIENINENYIDALFKNCSKFYTNQQYEGYCQGIICILQEFAELYKAVYKLMQQESISLVQATHNEENKKNSDSCKFSSDNDDSIMMKNLLEKIQKELIIISSRIPYLCEFILQYNQATYIYSSGQKLKKVGLIKYKILELIYQLLQINNPNKSQTQTRSSTRNSKIRSSLLSNTYYPYVDLKINFSEFDLVKVVQKYLVTLKWNNLMHKILIKIMRHILEQDYNNFKFRYIDSIENPKYGFLGILVELFRNKKFVFLNNMKFSNYGNIGVIYELSQLILKHLKQNDDYEKLTKKFPAFENLVNKDLIQYAKNCQVSDLFNSANFSDQRSSLIGSTHSLALPCEPSTKIIDQSIQQVLQQLQQSKRWTPKYQIRQKQKEKLKINQNLNLIRKTQRQSDSHKNHSRQQSQKLNIMTI